ncbi:MAG TPA: YbaB/EbfC family nucleoid-associated protein [Acidimicrobiales bacterium]|nr:YbaB/EbfC family nucleoid-associated protein [Acidimicrobiales bacterium]
MSDTPDLPIPGEPVGAPGALPDLGGLLEQAQQMQAQLLAAQAEAAEAVVEGHAGGGAVRIEMTAGGEFRSVHIDPSAVDPDDPGLLEDLVLAALHDATAQAAARQEQALGGLGLGGLGDLFGGS